MKPFTTPPFPPKLITALAHIGINNLADLQEKGAVHTFLLLKSQGNTLTNRTLWLLHAVCTEQAPQQLTEHDKQQLLTQLKQHPPVALFPPMHTMQYFMQTALRQAQLAAEQGEIPVGAVVVYQNQIIAQAHNRCIQDCHIGSHAEMNVLAQAGKILGNYRLNDCDVYITLEPCAMCASALIQARVKRVIFGAKEPKTGAAGSVINLFHHAMLNGHTAVLGNVLAKDSQALLQNFFQKKR